MLFQLESCLPSVIDGFSSCYDGNVSAVENLDGLTWLNVKIVIRIDIGHSSTSYTNVAGLVVIDEQFHQFLGKAPVAGQTHRHAREGAQHGNVVQRMVGGTKCTVGHTARYTKDGDWIL